MLNFEIRDDYSLADVLEAREFRGVEHIRTPHIGNQRLSDMVNLNQGIKVRLVDTNIQTKDNLFHPARVIAEGSGEVVARGDVLSSHNKIVKSSGRFSFVKEGRPLASVCQESVLRAFPKADCMPYGEWLEGNGEEVLQILELVTKKMPHLWERKVNALGETSRDEVLNFSKLVRDGVCGVNVSRDAAGWIIPNPVAILIDAIVDLQCSGKGEVIQIAGLSMHKYIGQDYRGLGKMSDLISELYSCVSSGSTKLRIPKDAKVDMVSLSSIGLAGPSSDKDLIISLVEAYEGCKKANAAVASLAKTGSLFNDAVALKKDSGERLRRAAGRVSWLFTKPETAKHFTQYDLLLQGESLYVHPWAINKPVRELVEFWSTIKKIAKI